MYAGYTLAFRKLALQLKAPAASPTSLATIDLDYLIAVEQDAYVAFEDVRITLPCEGLMRVIQGVCAGWLYAPGVQVG